MNEVKNPKRPLVYYSIIALLAILIFNIFATPALFATQVKEVDYGTFMKMTEDTTGAVRVGIEAMKRIIQADAK